MPGKIEEADVPLCCPMSSHKPVYVPGKIEKAVLTSVEVLCRWCRPVYVLRKIDKVVSVSEEVLRSSYRRVYVPRKIAIIVLVTVEVQ